MPADLPVIRVAVVEDNERLRANLALILDTTPGFACVAACGSAEAALEQLPRHTPQVVLMDIHLPGQSGIACVPALRARLPATQVLMLTIEEDADQVFAALEAGASGYLVKYVPPAELLEAIRSVHAGGAPMSSQIARRVVESFQRRGQSQRAEENLSPREQQVLRLIACGYRTKEVAEELGITSQTAQTHLRNIYEKMHVRSRAEAVARHLDRRTS